MKILETEEQKRGKEQKRMRIFKTERQENGRNRRAELKLGAKTKTEGEGLRLGFKVWV